MRTWPRIVFGGVLVVVVSLGVAYPLWWNHRSEDGGQALLQHSAIAKSESAPSAPCTSTFGTAVVPQTDTPGVLEIPSINLVAPVLNGLGDNVLNVAVGHDPDSPWPGGRGEAMVLAHDVSYFANLDNVKSGASVIWLTSCGKATFEVDKQAILKPGDLVYPASNGSGLALVTCYPTNALFWTSERYVVTAHLVSTTLTSEQLPKGATTALPQMTVPAPKALVSEGIDLGNNSLELGTLSIAGKPSANFAQSPEPLAIESDALEVFFGTKKAVQQQQASWWSDLTVPGLVRPSSWPSFGPVDVVINMSGSTPSSVFLTSPGSSATVVLQNGKWLLAALGG